MAPVIISIVDKHNPNKTHHFKFYNCGHTHYNQGCPNREFFYSRWNRIYPSRGFGYQEYFDQARHVYGEGRKYLAELCIAYPYRLSYRQRRSAFGGEQ